MHGKLLSFLDGATCAELFGPISLAVKCTGVIQGEWELPRFALIILLISDPANSLKVLTIAATVVAVFPPGFALLLPDLHLGDKQNAVDDTNLGGEKPHPPR